MLKLIYFSYSLPDGTKHTQSGYFTPLGKHLVTAFVTISACQSCKIVTYMNVAGYVMTGSWEYVGPDGSVFRTEFTADHEGYKPR